MTALALRLAEQLAMYFVSLARVFGVFAGFQLKNAAEKCAGNFLTILHSRGNIFDGKITS